VIALNVCRAFRTCASIVQHAAALAARARVCRKAATQSTSSQTWRHLQRRCCCAVTTGVGAALNTAQVRPGSSVAVFGTGGVGTSIIQGARIAGARQIIAVDLIDSKLDTARHFGATHTVNASKADPVKEIKALSDGGVDYSFEAIGNSRVLEQCFYSLAPRGICTLVGAIPTGQKVELVAGHFYIEKQIRGCFMGSNRFHLDMPRYLDLYRQGRLNLDDMVSRRGRLEDVNEAFRAMEAGEVTRTVLTFS
jgi:S-(hydroxymethyl)glutathione dehydrogenase / alcohol dehydrogenase